MRLSNACTMPANGIHAGRSAMAWSYEASRLDRRLAEFHRALVASSLNERQHKESASEFARSGRQVPSLAFF